MVTLSFILNFYKLHWKKIIHISIRSSTVKLLNQSLYIYIHTYIFKWLCDTIFTHSKCKNTWKMEVDCNVQDILNMNSEYFKFKISDTLFNQSCSTISEWRHCCNGSLNAAIWTIFQRSFKKSELIYCINSFFLKDLNVNYSYIYFFRGTGY